jgi:hypothetical protein
MATSLLAVWTTNAPLAPGQSQTWASGSDVDQNSYFDFMATSGNGYFTTKTWWAFGILYCEVTNAGPDDGSTPTYNLISVSIVADGTTANNFTMEIQQ